MLIGGVVQNHFNDDADFAFVGGVKDFAEILQRSIAGMNRVIVRNVVAVIAQRGREERHQPDRIDPQLSQVIKLLFEPGKVANAIGIAVVKSANVHLINDCVFVPEGIRIEWQTANSWGTAVTRGRIGNTKSLYEAKLLEHAGSRAKMRVLSDQLGSSNCV